MQIETSQQKRTVAQYRHTPLMVAFAQALLGESYFQPAHKRLENLTTFTLSFSANTYASLGLVVTIIA